MPLPSAHALADAAPVLKRAAPALESRSTHGGFAALLTAPDPAAPPAPAPGDAQLPQLLPAAWRARASPAAAGSPSRVRHAPVAAADLPASPVAAMNAALQAAVAPVLPALNIGVSSVHAAAAAAPRDAAHALPKQPDARPGNPPAPAAPAPAAGFVPSIARADDFSIPSQPAPASPAGAAAGLLDTPAPQEAARAAAPRPEPAAKPVARMAAVPQAADPSGPALPAAAPLPAGAAAFNLAPVPVPAGVAAPDPAPQAASASAQGQDVPSAFPAPEANPATVPPAPPGVQMAQAVLGLHLRPDGSSELSIRLHPAELGEIHVQITRARDGAASISVAVERPDTLRAMQSDLTHLHLALDRAGVPEQRSLIVHQAVPQDAGAIAGGAQQGTGGGQPGPQGGSHQPPRQSSAAPPSAVVPGGEAAFVRPSSQPSATGARAGVDFVA